MERMAGDVEKREVSTGGNGREAEAERLIPRRRIIGTKEGMVCREEVHEVTADPLQTVQYERDCLPILVKEAVILPVSPISPLIYSPYRLAAVQ